MARIVLLFIRSSICLFLQIETILEPTEMVLFFSSPPLSSGLVWTHLTQHVPGEQEHPGDVPALQPGPPGAGSLAVGGGRGGELWRAASAPGHVGAEGGPETPAAGGRGPTHPALHHPH